MFGWCLYDGSDCTAAVDWYWYMAGVYYSTPSFRPGYQPGGSGCSEGSDCNSNDDCGNGVCDASNTCDCNL